MDGNVGHRCDKTHKMFELDENDNCKIINNLKKKSKYHTSITNKNTFNTHKNLNTNTNTNPDIDNTAHIIKKINLKLNRNKLDLNKTSYSPTCEINNSNSSPFVKSYSNRNLNGRSSRNSKISHYVGYRHKTLESETPLS
jgi:hypothetical protein